MPTAEVSTLPPPHLLSRDAPNSLGTQRPATEIIRARSVTPTPAQDPRPPTPVERPQDPTEKTSSDDEECEAPGPSPTASQPRVPESQQDDDVASTLDVVHMDTFNQILELDEDEDTHDFSQPMVWSYFEQAEITFKDLEDALGREDLETLSSLGHYLKGSSAALGLSRVQDSCEQIQHLGHLRDEEKGVSLTPAEALSKLKIMVKRVQIQYKEAENWLKDFFEED